MCVLIETLCVCVWVCVGGWVGVYNFLFFLRLSYRAARFSLWQSLSPFLVLLLMKVCKTLYVCVCGGGVGVGVMCVICDVGDV